MKWNPRILATGGTGKLGSVLQQEFPGALFPPRDELDLREESSVDACLRAVRPTVVIHAAAFTSVAAGEKNRRECWEVNVRGTERLVQCAIRYQPDVYFVYVSTACVFSGMEGNYDEDGIPAPKNFYGLTKLLGEFIARRVARHLVVRTNFVRRGPWPHPRAFVDRYGTYLYADDVAKAIGRLTQESMLGTVHVAGRRRFSMFELAKLTTPEVLPLTMAEVDVPLTADMTLTSVRVPPVNITV